MTNQVALIGTDAGGGVLAAVEAGSGDDQLLDSYSRTIAAVVNRVVVNIRVIR